MCSIIFAAADRSALSCPLLAKNRDRELGHHLGSDFLVRDRLSLALVGVAFRHAPRLISQGINEKGLCLAYNFVKIRKAGWEKDWEPVPGASARQRRAGALGRRILGRCVSVEDALELLAAETGPGCYLGGTMVLADSRGGALVEGAGDDMAVRHLSSGVEIRNNHFLLLPDLGPDVDEYPSSYRRGRRCAELLAPRRVVDTTALAGVLRDHDPWPSEDSICRHAEVDDPLAHFTVASVIMIPRNAGGAPELLYASGHPCEASYVSYIPG
ncbi:MAG TPA: carcinine hydrolase/isopenicillin-N N-acyltransferase family protein [Longimicrobiales bacterium]|nr:carcinine hydrolase/isopenicillin-N N-acyltransferase family protein [Longimicrobiales bacterium]